MTIEKRHELRLEVRVDDLRGVRTPQLVPRVDGSVLALDLDTRETSEASGLGMNPGILLDRNSPLLPTGPTADLEEPAPLATLWRCNCGEPGCRSIRARVSRENIGRGNDAVVWDDWQIRLGGASSPGPLRFETHAYYAEFIRAHNDRWWEDVPQRVAREISASLDADPAVLGRWGCLFGFARGYCRDSHGHVEIELRSATTRTFLGLDCDPDADPAVETQRLLGVLTDNHPDTLPARYRSSTL